MLKQFWLWFICVPADLDLSDKIYLRLQYACCALIALNGPVFIVAAVTSHRSLWVNLALIGAAVVCIAAALAMRVFMFWMYVMRDRLLNYLGLV